MTCPRCGAAIIWRNEDGDPNCICGYIHVADIDVAKALGLRAVQPKGGRRLGGRQRTDPAKVCAEHQASINNARRSHRQRLRREAWAERVADDLIAAFQQEKAP